MILVKTTDLVVFLGALLDQFGKRVINITDAGAATWDGKAQEIKFWVQKT